MSIVIEPDAVAAAGSLEKRYGPDLHSHAVRLAPNRPRPPSRAGPARCDISSALSTNPHSD